MRFARSHAHDTRGRARYRRGSTIVENIVADLRRRRGREQPTTKSCKPSSSHLISSLYMSLVFISSTSRVRWRACWCFFCECAYFVCGLHTICLMMNGLSSVMRCYNNDATAWSIVRSAIVFELCSFLRVEVVKDEALLRITFDDDESVLADSYAEFSDALYRVPGRSTKETTRSIPCLYEGKTTTMTTSRRYFKGFSPDRREARRYLCAILCDRHYELIKRNPRARN